MPAKNLSDQALGAIALDRAPQFLGGGNPQARHGIWAMQQENGHRPAVQLAPTIIDVLKIGPVPDVLASPESLIRHAARRAHRSAGSAGPREGDGSVRRDRQPLAALGPATLQHDAAVLGPHAHEEPVGPTASAVIGLKGALHRFEFPLGQAGTRRQDPSGPAS